MQKLNIGAIGVMLDDAAVPARMYTYAGMFSCVIAIFDPVDNGPRVYRDIWHFWPLLDAMP